MSGPLRGVFFFDSHCSWTDQDFESPWPSDSLISMWYNNVSLLTYLLEAILTATCCGHEPFRERVASSSTKLVQFFIKHEVQLFRLVVPRLSVRPVVNSHRSHISSFGGFPCFVTPQPRCPKEQIITISQQNAFETYLACFVIMSSSSSSRFLMWPK